MPSKSGCKYGTRVTKKGKTPGKKYCLSKKQSDAHQRGRKKCSTMYKVSKKSHQKYCMSKKSYDAKRRASALKIQKAYRMRR